MDRPPSRNGLEHQCRVKRRKLEPVAGQQPLDHLRVDGLVEEPAEGEIEALVSEIARDGLEQMKATVTVREWMQA